MPQVREVTENHNDFEYRVVQLETGKVCGYRTPLDGGLAARKKRVPYQELPSASLKEAFQKYTGLSDRELNP